MNTDAKVSLPMVRSYRNPIDLAIGALSLYRQFWRQLLLLALLPRILAASIVAFFDTDLNPDPAWQASFAFVLEAFATFGTFVLVEAAVQELGTRGHLRTSALRDALVALPSALGALILIVAISVAVVIVPLAGLVAAAYLYTRFSLAFEFAVLDREAPPTALRQAWALTKSGFWWVFLGIWTWQVVSIGLGTLPLVVNPWLARGLFAVSVPAMAAYRVLLYRTVQRSPQPEDELVAA